MDETHLILWAIYFVPYLVAVLMPGWKSLGVFTAITAALGLWFGAVEMNRTGGGLAQAATVAILGLALIGAVVGIIVRAIILASKRFAPPRWVGFAWILVGALLPIAVVLLGDGYFL